MTHALDTLDVERRRLIQSIKSATHHCAQLKHELILEQGNLEVFGARLAEIETAKESLAR